MMLKSFTLTVLLLSAALSLGAVTAVAADSPYMTAYQAGQTLEKAGKFAEARAEFEKALAINGITPEQTGQTLFEIGACLISDKKVQEGIGESARAEGDFKPPLDPGKYFVRTNLSGVPMGVGSGQGCLRSKPGASRDYS
jgi:tetratricopeptide (TPR) repeat protein